jgi:hypothetical protein
MRTCHAAADRAWQLRTDARRPPGLMLTVTGPSAAETTRASRPPSGIATGRSVRVRDVPRTSGCVRERPRQSA